jgi:hypothetical protein
MLDKKFSKTGVIVPPPPRMTNINIFYTIKSNISNKWEVNVGKIISMFNHSNEILKLIISVDHTIRLTSYLRQLATHPTLKDDPNMLNFLQDVELVKPDISFDMKKMFGEAVKKVILIRNL